MQPRPASAPSLGAAGSQVPSALPWRHILFVQKPEQESNQEDSVTQRLGWVLPGPVGSDGQDGCGSLGQADVTSINGLLTCHLGLGPSREAAGLMCFAQLKRNTLMLWPPGGCLMALGLENREVTRNQDAPDACGLLGPLLSQEASLCSLPALEALLGRVCGFCSCFPGPASGGLMSWLVPVLSSPPWVLHPHHCPPGSPLGRTSPPSLRGSLPPSEAP